MGIKWEQTLAFREQVEKEVIAAVTEWHAAQDPKERGPISHYCWVWAAKTVEVLKRHGIPSQVNAGSAMWRVKDDDGVNPDHYGYQFAWNKESALQFALGNLPEMHAWVVVLPKDCDRGKEQVIDFTVRFQAQRAMNEGIIPDLALQDYLWAYLDRIPDGFHYEADWYATKLVHMILKGMD